MRSHAICSLNWLRALRGAIGAMLIFNRVRAQCRTDFHPQQVFDVSPEFLDTTISATRARGIDLISLDAVYDRLTRREPPKPFASLMFADGYKDTFTVAYPVLKRHGVPFAIYIATSVPDRLAEHWSVTLGTIIAKHDRIGLIMNNEDRRFRCRTLAEKRDVFGLLSTWFGSQIKENDRRQLICDLARRYRLDLARQQQELCISWTELALLASDPLCTIGAQGVHRRPLQALSAKAARFEMVESVRVLEAALGIRARHFAYPGQGGDAAGPREFVLAESLQFRTAVMTEGRLIARSDRHHLTSLPAIRLSGGYPQLRCLHWALSG